MRTETAHAYLYAIAVPRHPLPAALCGLEGQAVTGIDCAEVKAIVSEIRHAHIRPERAHLHAHHQVVRALMATGTVLPVAFGTIAASRGELHEVLCRQSHRLVPQLERLQGMVEMNLTARLDVPDVYAHLVERFPGLRAARDAVFGPGRAMHDQKIALGMQVEQALALLRERSLSDVLPAVEPVCADICHNPPRAVDELLNLACLLARSGQPAFEAALSQLASSLDDSLSFGISGPWAPHHFCRIELEAIGDPAGH